MQSSLDHGLTELAGFRDGTKFPAMDPKRRSSEIGELERKVERLRADVDRFTPIVGDPEDVVDEHGWLPRDRREQTWWSYRLDREGKVRDLKRRLPELEAPLKTTSDHGERRDRRARLAEATRDLDRLIAEGPFDGGGHVLGVCDPDGASRVGLAPRPSMSRVARLGRKDARGAADARVVRGEPRDEGGATGRA